MFTFIDSFTLSSYTLVAIVGGTTKDSGYEERYFTGNKLVSVK